jgi:lysophospholipase L1-like esterase
MPLIVESRSRLVMIGDSITDCGRARPVGEGSPDALGNGYVGLINGLLSATYPTQRIRIINMGIGGNTVRDLKGRWQSDVLALEPNWLSIMIGINDVWRQFDSPLQAEKHVGLSEFEQTLDELIQNTLPGLSGLVLMTPYFVEPNRADPMRKMMDAYSEAVRRLAEKHQAILVDTQLAWDEMLSEIHSVALAADRIHPNLIGHMILARAFLSAIGYSW